MEDSFEVSALKDHLSACKGQCKALEARVKELEAALEVEKMNHDFTFLKLKHLKERHSECK